MNKEQAIHIARFLKREFDYLWKIRPFRQSDGRWAIGLWITPMIGRVATTPLDAFFAEEYFAYLGEQLRLAGCGPTSSPELT